MLEIHEAVGDELEAWDHLVRHFPNYRLSHLRVWLDFLTAAGCGRPLPLVFTRNDEVVGCLPGLLVRLGPLRLFGSPLPGWQTASMGPVFDAARLEPTEMMRTLLPFLERRYGVHHIELVTPSLDPEAMRTAGFHGEPVPTFRATLYPDDEARVLKSFKDSARRNIRRAEKLGLAVRFEEDEAFVGEHYEQIKEVYVRGGNTVTFSKERVRECFRRMRDAGHLLAASVYLADGRTSIASGMFLVEGEELLLWTWAHRVGYRWHRPTELMTWTVVRRALALGCRTFDLMGLGDFKAKFGAELDYGKHRWVRSRYRWLGAARRLAERGYRWQQSLRGRVARRLTASREAGDGREETT